MFNLRPFGISMMRQRSATLHRTAPFALRRKMNVAHPEGCSAMHVSLATQVRLSQVHACNYIMEVNVRS